MSDPTWEDRRIYGRRQDKVLRRRPQRLMEELLPQVAITPETAAETVSAHHGNVWLEVGFGGGEHLAWQAGENPGTLMIGAEPFINGVAKLVTQIEDHDIKNIRVLHGDARPLMEALPDRSLSRIFVLHPDPWPKMKHHKRRMISLPFLHHAARLLKSGSELRVSSDIPDYIRWTFLQMNLHNKCSTDFEWTATCRPDWTDRADDWPQTRYEAKAIREGRVPTYLKFRRT